MNKSPACEHVRFLTRRNPLLCWVRGMVHGMSTDQGVYPMAGASRLQGGDMKSLGYHLILELEGCPGAVLNDPDAVSRIMIEAVDASGATMIRPFFHQFAPQGVSGVVIISESHFSVHTWPEYGYAAVDIFTCGDQIDMDMAAEKLRFGFEATSLQKMLLSRGMLDLPDHMIRHKPEPPLKLVPET